jgi:prepilin-type N-terminal cleavage/methylation domain-containing protein
MRSLTFFQQDRPEMDRHSLRRTGGFTVIEMLITLIIVGILSAIGVPSYLKLMKSYTLNQYAANMDYLVKYARVMAMEKTTNSGICVNSSTQLIIYNIGTNRGSGICTGTASMTLNIDSSHASGYNISINGSGGSYDPRGIAIQLGNVCVTNGSKYFKTVISRTGMRSEEGAGGCS